MSTRQASRKESSRGPEWDRKALDIAIRDGAYRDAEGRLHKVCRNWTEAKRQGLEDSLPAGCRRSSGEAAVWACHSNSWSKYPALRLVNDNIMDLCRFCDPDRNPAMRAHWWGDPKRPVTAGWERRRKRWHMKRHKLAGMGALFAAGILSTSHGLPHHALWGWGALGLSLALWPELGIATVLWFALVAAGIHFRWLHAPVTLGGWLAWMAALVGAWLACLLATIVGLAHLPGLGRKR